MKVRDPGYWYQSRMDITNINILTNLRLSDLLSLTTTEVCRLDQLGEEQVYMAWPDMKWKVVGDVATVNVSLSTLCRRQEESFFTLLPGQFYCV